MASPIRITVGALVLDGELNETAAAKRVYDALPIEAEVNRWGDEIYFSIPVTGATGDEMRTEMQVGELAFWPPGNAFCIFWGPTPASQADEPRAASDVVPIGRLIGDLTRLSETTDGQPIRIEGADS